jgi:hypothetical protein
MYWFIIGGAGLSKYSDAGPLVQSQVKPLAGDKPDIPGSDSIVDLPGPGILIRQREGASVNNG